MQNTSERQLTGWHVLAMFCVGFGIIISVNLVLATQAVRTFPGLVVGNSYVASQSFDARRSEQKALGWAAEATAKGGYLELRLTEPGGSLADPAFVKARLGRPTTSAEDVMPVLERHAAGWRAKIDVPEGRWTLWITAQSLDGQAFEKRMPLQVKK